MKRKAIAIAVVGALGAPALAYAQASTVQIYGNVRLEYSYIDEGANRLRYDRMRNPGSSYIGFRGTERLGGGNEAWFQLEQNFPGDGAGQSNVGTWGDRNTAVGLKGNFGNFFVGQWDTPYKRSAADTNYRPFDTTGITSVGSIMHNETTGGGANGTRAGSNATSFWRRQQNALNYHSPNWGGFKFMFAWSAADEKTGLASGTGAANPRLWSLGATYINGPLAIGAGYERHNDYNPAGLVVGTAAGQYNGGSDTAWMLNAAYTFAGVFRLGGVYERLRYDVAVGQNVDRNAWGVFGDWKIQGPHSLRLGYVKGNSAGGNATGINVNSIASPLTAAGVGQSGGANMWMIRYAYGLSKRTEVNLGYSRLNNDAAGRYRIHGTTRNAGQDMNAWGVGLWHRF